MKDPILRRLGHQLGVRATKPLVPRLLLAHARGADARRRARAAPPPPRRRSGSASSGSPAASRARSPARSTASRSSAPDRQARIEPAVEDRRDRAARRAALLRELRGLYRLARLALRTRGAPACRPHDSAARRRARQRPRHAAGRRTCSRRSCDARLVYDAHELYSEFDATRPRARPRAAHPRSSGALARRADAVVTVSEPIAEELRARGSASSRSSS